MARTLDDLASMLDQHDGYAVNRERGCISLTTDDGLDIFVFQAENHIFVESILFPVSAVTDECALNKLILSTHHLMPLTDICIKTYFGDDYYVAFGALSASSRDEVVMEEISVLTENIPDFLDAYSAFLKLEEYK